MITKKDFIEGILLDIDNLEFQTEQYICDDGTTSERISITDTKRKIREIINNNFDLIRQEVLN